MCTQVRQVDAYAGSSPEFVGDPEGGFRRSSRGSTASEVLEETLTPFLRGSGSGTEDSGRQSRGSMGSYLGEESAQPSLAILITSDDRLELTLSPGSVEAILNLLQVRHICTYMSRSELHLLVYILPISDCVASPYCISVFSPSIKRKEAWKRS